MAAFWDTLTARPGGSPDLHAQARELLAGHDIPVPAAFTPAQMGQLAGAADVRLALAARSAAGGQVVQFLAGAPELLARYRNAPPAARALIEAAIDPAGWAWAPGCRTASWKSVSDFLCAGLFAVRYRMFIRCPLFALSDAVVPVLSSGFAESDLPLLPRQMLRVPVIPAFAVVQGAAA